MSDLRQVVSTYAAILFMKSTGHSCALATHACAPHTPSLGAQFYRHLMDSGLKKKMAGVRFV